MKWHKDVDGVEKFLMSERQEGSFTTQCARKGDLYLSKIVDIKDKSTWITIVDFKNKFN